MTYAKFFDACQVVLQERERKGEVYRPGVVRAAALAAMEQLEHGCGRHAAIDAIERAFHEHVMAIKPVSVTANYA